MNTIHTYIHTDAVKLHDIINEKHIHCWHIHVKTQQNLYYLKMKRFYNPALWLVYKAPYISIVLKPNVELMGRGHKQDRRNEYEKCLTVVSVNKP